MVAEKATKIAASGANISSNIETDYDKPRKKSKPSRFKTSDSDNGREDEPPKKRPKKKNPKIIRE